MKNKKLLIIFAILFVAFSFFENIVNLYTDWLWFKEIQFGGIFTKVLLTKFTTGGIFGVAFFIFAYLNFYLASMIGRKENLSRQYSEQGNSVEVIGPAKIKNTNYLILITSCLVSLFVGLIGANLWDTVLKFLNSTPFGMIDPIFGKDISFYVFQFPLYESLQGMVFFLSSLLH